MLVCPLGIFTVLVDVLSVIKKYIPSVPFICLNSERLTKSRMIYSGDYIYIMFFPEQATREIPVQSISDVSLSPH